MTTAVSATASPMTEIQQSVRLINEGRSRMNEGRAMLAKAFGDEFGPLTPAKLALLEEVAGLGAVEDVALGLDVSAKPTNVERVASLRAADKPSLKQGIIQILTEAGRTMSADEIFAEVEKRNWLPANAEHPRKYIGHYLSTYSDDFLRDTAAGRGHYYVGKKAKPEVAKASVKKAAAKPAKKKENPAKRLARSARILAVIGKVKKPVTIPDIAKRAKLGDQYRSVTALFMTLEKGEVAKRLGRNVKGEFQAKTSAGGHTLWEVDHAKLVEFIKNQAN